MEHKIKAELDGEQIKVHADYFDGKKKVYEINTAFPLETSEKEIKEAVVKAGTLFDQEKEQAVEQGKVDKKFGNAQKVISNLNK